MAGPTDSSARPETAHNNFSCQNKNNRQTLDTLKTRPKHDAAAQKFRHIRAAMQRFYLEVK
jgi:hypothetical protein